MKAVTEDSQAKIGEIYKEGQQHDSSSTLVKQTEVAVGALLKAKAEKQTLLTDNETTPDAVKKTIEAYEEKTEKSEKDYEEDILIPLLESNRKEVGAANFLFAKQNLDDKGRVVIDKLEAQREKNEKRLKRKRKTEQQALPVKKRSFFSFVPFFG